MHLRKKGKRVHHFLIFVGGFLTIDSIQTVTEGDNITVCVNMTSSGSILDFPLEVHLVVSGSTKAGI